MSDLRGRVVGKLDMLSDVCFQFVEMGTPLFLLVCSGRFVK